MKEIIELTRVILPIGVISICLKLVFMIFAYLAFSDVSYINTSVYLLRFVRFFFYRNLKKIYTQNLIDSDNNGVCWTYSSNDSSQIDITKSRSSPHFWYFYVYINVIPGSDTGGSHSSAESVVFTTEDVTLTYFDALQKDWNA